MTDKPERAKTPTKFFDKFCHLTNIGWLRHYQVVHCTCGKVYWALQPKRDGELELHQYPGRLVE